MEELTLSSSSSSGKDDQHPDPDGCVHQSAAEVSFGFNQLQIDDNGANTHQLMPESEETDDDEEKEKEEGDDFTFVCIGDNGSSTTEELEDGLIRPTIPLFGQTLLLGGDEDGGGRRRLPFRVPVDNVFIEPPSSMASGVAAVTFYGLSKESDTGTPKMNMKSNSTGSSKLWSYKGKMNRSNSHGSYASVFLKSPDTAADVSDGRTEVVKKGSNATESALETYLKKKRAEKKRWGPYAPIRPPLRGGWGGPKFDNPFKKCNPTKK